MKVARRDVTLGARRASTWKEGMEPKELFETLSQALLASVDRDDISGWGATVHIVTKDGVMSRELKARQD